MFQLLERVQYAPVWPQLFVSHDLLQGHQTSYIKRTRIICAVIGRVQIDDGTFSADGGEKLMHAITVCRFPRSRRAND